MSQSAPTDTAQPGTALSDAAQAHAQWHRARERAVSAPTGNLALVQTRWLSEVTDADSAAQAAATTSAAETQTVTTVQRHDVETGQTAYGIRVWDAASPAIRAFEGIGVFDYVPEWIVHARFVPVSTDRTVPFEHVRDNGETRELVVPGDIVFDRDGTTYRLSAFDDGGVLLLVFGDATNGRSDAFGTYGSGRFLTVTRTDDGGFGEPGDVVLDFNRAFIPPCGFSAQYNCPMPPPENRFGVPVAAGEKRVRFADGFDLYAPPA